MRAYHRLFNAVQNFLASLFPVCHNVANMGGVIEPLEMRTLLTTITGTTSADNIYIRTDPNDSAYTQIYNSTSTINLATDTPSHAPRCNDLAGHRRTWSSANWAIPRSGVGRDGK